MREKQMWRKFRFARHATATADVTIKFPVAKKANAQFRPSNDSKWFHRFMVTAFLVGFCSSMSLAQDAPLDINGATTLDANGVVELVLNTPGLTIVDTRTKADFEGGHIEGAINILDTDITSDSVLAAVVNSKMSPLLFYCNGVKCGRAAKATSKAVKWGYSKVYYYALGINDWKSVQFPLVTQ
jgi:rhodanese-related sulfurtransferase